MGVMSIEKKALEKSRAPSAFKLGVGVTTEARERSGSTLKALANSSPGFALWQPLGSQNPMRLVATPNELRLRSSLQMPTQLLISSELRLREIDALCSGLPKSNPGLELANAFSVKDG
jgi:hypothetical protein